MRWRGRRQSKNVEDLRGQPGTRLGGSTAKRGAMGGGFGLIIMVVLALVFGVDPSALLSGGATGGGMPQISAGGPSNSVPGEIKNTNNAAQDEVAQMLTVVLADTEEVWERIFAQIGQRYRDPTMTLFDGHVPTACGTGSSAMGPFYCPGDQKVYLDLDFFRDLQNRHGAPGDFAQAYVVAHEVGHHVQTLLGISRQVHQQKQRSSKIQSNQLSVRQELQADCFAGLWAHHAHQSWQILERGDIEEALNAASAIGDDRLQKQARGYATPDSFTHGSSEQRMRWFRLGLETGDIGQCDTFQAARI